MKTKLTEATFKPGMGLVGKLFSRLACLGALVLICSSAAAQALFVSGNDLRGGMVFQFAWDGKQSVFAFGLTDPSNMAFDSAGNLFVVDYDRGALFGEAAIYKITPSKTLTIFASGLSYNSCLAANRAGDLFVADYNDGIIYQYKSTGSRATFASGLHHPAGLAFDSLGNLFVVDNNIGNIYQGHIYQYKPDGSQTIFAVLDAGDRPAGLAFDSMGSLLMADWGGNIYKYDPNGVLRRHGIRAIYGSVPNSAQSLAFDGAGNLFVVDGGDANGKGNAIYKFTQVGVRSAFASGNALQEIFSHIAFEPMLPTSQ